MKIILVSYSALWPLAFEKEKDKISALSPPVGIAGIEHIGSTAVEGLIAKPIIDMMIGLVDFERDAALFVEIMTNIGYRYNANYEYLMPYRRFFQYAATDLNYNIHTVQHGSEFWERHLLFRNYLRHNSRKRDQYAAHKKALADQDWDNTGDYADAKTPFIRQLEQEAKLFFLEENSAL